MAFLIPDLALAHETVAHAAENKALTKMRHTDQYRWRATSGEDSSCLSLIHSEARAINDVPRFFFLDCLQIGKPILNFIHILFTGSTEKMCEVCLTCILGVQ
jgi:hypothetical protein